MPVTALAAGDLVPGKELRIRDLRVAVGRAEATGTGSYLPFGRRLAFAGKFLVPRGKISEYGWVYPLSWKNVSGVWELSGSKDNPRLIAGVRAEELAARALRPVPLSLKLEGDLSDVVHFVADIPADVAKVTAVGTITGPLSHRASYLEATIGARDIDFSLVGDWSAAVLSSLGKDPSQLKRHTAGMSGTGTADLRLSLAKGSRALSATISSPEIRWPQVRAREISASGNWGESISGSLWDFRARGEFGKGEFLLAGKGEGGEAEISGTMKDIDLETAVSLVDREFGARIGGRLDLQLEARGGPKGWEIGKLSASVPRLSAPGMTVEGIAAEGSLGPSSGTLTLVSSSPKVEASAEIRREKGWPVSFSVTAQGIPTGTLLRAIGREGATGSGTWDASAEGILKASGILAGNALQPETYSAFRFSLSSASPSVSGISFASVIAEGKMEGDAITGEIMTRMPETRLSLSLSLREPFRFRVEGPFAVEERTVREPAGGPDGPRESVEANGNGKARFVAAGTVQISGSLRALDDSRGTLEVQRMFYRYGGVELTGERISVLLSGEGIRWESGSLQTSGNPLHISGKASWDGNLDARLDGKVPAAAIRLATDVFDRLDGLIRIGIRIGGKWDDPSVIGTGTLEDATFSFRGYDQLFEKMHADAVISREKIIFEHFEGRSGGGYIDGRGELPLRFAEGQKMFFSVDFFDMQYPYPEDLRPMLQGHVELIGPVNDLLITGDVEIQSARYTKTVVPERALLDFRKRVADVTARRKESDFRIRLDLEALADGTIQVKNNLAEAEIKGEFKVVGDTSRVILLGAFDVTEGRVNYRGNRYELIRGGVEFRDPRRNNPLLDFRAETKKANVNITVLVTGTLERYEVELFSDPPLSKNDIVSLLTLGVTTESLAEGGGGAVSAAEAAAIALGPYKGRVEEGISNVIGLDKFAIEPAYSSTNKSTEPRFIVGKTFGERFSVSVTTNVGSTTESSALAEFKILENVYLQGNWESATTTRGGDLGADVRLRYRYRSFRDFLLGSE
ncbi:MAG TPA: translocation/assembly module TamB domain-containing protein [Candidatus Deferrimicrobiaceae bacterium]|nr:translocation/assembly module TamB domain-containing protein [Candidatus Deferrimicrobiaceae bacterium]